MSAAASVRSAVVTFPRPWCRRSIACRSGVDRYLRDPEFLREFHDELHSWVGRATPLTFARTLSKQWGAEIWLKREDLAHTGAHKINNSIGQVLLAKKLGAKRVIAETGARPARRCFAACARDSACRAPCIWARSTWSARRPTSAA